MKRLKFMDPQQIISVVVCLIVLAVGIFAFFTVTTNVQSAATDVPIGNYGVTAQKATTGNVVVATASAGHCYITVVSTFQNFSTVCKLDCYNATTGVWDAVQIYGACNGTFIHNNLTYRVEPGLRQGPVHNTIWRLTYSANNTATTGDNNRTWKSLNNNSYTGGQVFNIVGIVIMIGAIMSIIGIIYSYLRPY